MVVVEISRANRTPGKVPALSIRFAELASLSQLPNPAWCTLQVLESSRDIPSTWVPDIITKNEDQAPATESIQGVNQGIGIPSVHLPFE